MMNFFSKYKILFYILNFFLVFFYLFPGSILGWLMYKNLKLQPQITPDFFVSVGFVSGGNMGILLTALRREPHGNSVMRKWDRILF